MWLRKEVMWHITWFIVCGVITFVTIMAFIQPNFTYLQSYTAHWPVLACYLCYSQLRKCHNLMVRSVRVDEVLTKIQQSGEVLKEESISMLSRVRQELRNDLCFTKVDITSIEAKSIEHDFIESNVNEAPVLSQCTYEMEIDPLLCVDRLKCEGSEEDMKGAALEDDKSQGLIVVKYELVEEMLDMKNNELTCKEHVHLKKTEGAECMKRMEPEGAAPTKKCEQIHMEQIEHGSTLTSDENNIQKKPRTSRTVIKEESPCIDFLSNTRNVPNKIEGLPNPCLYSDTAINNSNVCIINDNNCTSTNTDDDNGSKHLKNSIICDDYGNFFDDKDVLVKHIEHHNIKKNNRNISSRHNISHKQSFNRARLTNKHTETNSGNSLFMCEICQRTYSKLHLLKRHLRTHTGEKPFQCDICKGRFTLKDTLTRHLRKHTNEKPFECQICKHRFALKSILKIHLRIHSREKPFGCEICQYRCSQKGSLKIHLRTHTQEKPFECEICHYRCNQKSSLNKHLKTHLPIHTREKLFECEICKVRLSGKGSLKSHMLTHTDEKPFECEICKVRFKHKENFKRHFKLMHTNEKPFECEICKFKFSLKNQLTRHFRTHTNEKPFECEICKVRFTRKCYLKTHLRTHTGEKPYECEICKVRFSQKGSVKIHLRTHTGEKPFECEICKVRFSLKASLNIHLRTHTRI